MSAPASLHRDPAAAGQQRQPRPTNSPPRATSEGLNFRLHLRPSLSNPARDRAGFTLLELMATITILVILMLLMSGVFSKLPGAGDRVRCTQNLKDIYVGLSSYIDEKGHWPNQPEFTYQQRKEYEDYWLDALKPYGVTKEVWQCPGIKRLGNIRSDGTNPRVHYKPTMFDQKPTTPRKWPNMPWVVEIGNAHGHGPLLILQDGSVHDWDTFLEQLAK
ncbi:MAG: type II secretion system protein [Chthoniobacterales bacterium]